MIGAREPENKGYGNIQPSAADIGGGGVGEVKQGQFALGPQCRGAPKQC